MEIFGKPPVETSTTKAQALLLSAALVFTPSIVLAKVNKTISPNASPEVWATKKADDYRAKHETIVNEQHQRDIIKALQTAMEVKNNDHDRGYRHGSARPKNKSHK